MRGCAGRSPQPVPVGPPSTQESGFWKSQKGLGRGRKDPALCSSIPRDSPSSWLHLCASKVAPGGSGSPGITLDPIQIHPSRIHHPSHTRRLVHQPAATPQTPPVPSAPFCSQFGCCQSIRSSFLFPCFCRAQQRLQPRFTAQYSKPLLL